MKSKLSVVAIAVSLVACGGGGGGGGGEAVSPQTFSSSTPGMVTGQVPGITITESALGPFSLLGTVQGLTGSGLLLDSGYSRANVSANVRAFGMIQKVPANAEYNVFVQEQPINPTQVCTVVNGHGIAKSIVSNIAVNCVSTAKFAVVVQKNAQGGALQTFAYDQATGSIGERALQSETLIAAESNSAMRSKVIRNPGKSVVYVMSEEGKSITPFVINEKTGVPTKMPKLNMGGIPQDATMSPDGKRLYSLIRGTAKLAVSMLGEAGEFVAGQSGSHDNPTANDSYLAVKAHSDGKHVYVASTAGFLRVIKVDKDETTAVVSSMDGFAGLNGVALAPNSKFAYLSMDNLSGISMVRLESDASIGTDEFFNFAGKISNVRGLTIDPTGNFMFGLDTTLNAVVSWKLDQTTGEATYVGTVPVDANASSEITIDPQGRFVYLSALNSGGFVRGFSIDQKTGSLTALSIMQTGFGSTHAIQLY